MKINYHAEVKGKCKNCGDDKPEYRIETKGKRKGESFIKSKFFKVFEEVSCFRGEDEYLGKFCKKCFEAKAYLTTPSEEDCNGRN